MSDLIELPTGEHVPIQDTICVCGHWYEEHGYDDGRGEFCAGCSASGNVEPDHSFLADVDASTAEAIADRGGDPARWPQHVKAKFAGTSWNSARERVEMRATKEDYETVDSALRALSNAWVREQVPTLDEGLVLAADARAALARLTVAAERGAAALARLTAAAERGT